MKVEVKQPESWRRVLAFEIGEDVVGEEYGRKLAKVKRDVKLPGFRPGKVPEDILNTRYGKAIRAEVIEEIIQRSFEQACKDKGISPVGGSRVSDLADESGKPLSFTVETEVDPDVDIQGYDKLKIKLGLKKIKKADVNEAIDSLRERFADFTDVERPATKGDFVVMEYQKVVVEGEEKSDVSSPAYPIELGTSKIKDFDKSLLGRSAGEVADVSIRFPADYGDENLADKRADLTILIKKVQEKHLPEITPEFLKKLGEFADEDALREFVEKDLQRRELERARNEAYNKAVDQLLERNRIDVPPSRIERYIDHVHEEMTKCAQPGQPVPSREEADTRYRATAERTLKRFRLLTTIATKENIKPTQEEVDAEVRKVAERYGHPFEQVKDAFRKNGTVDRIRADLREAKTLSFLIKDDGAVDEADAD